MLQIQPENIYDESTKILSGPTLKPFYDRNCSLGSIVFEELRRRPNHICQICDSDGTTLTNDEFRLLGIRLARYYESLNLTQDDIVGFVGRNTTYASSVPLSCFLSGIACHAISPKHDKETSRKLFNMTKPKVIFCDGQDLEKIRYVSQDLKVQIFTVCDHIEGVPSMLELLKPTGDEHSFVPAELQYGPDQTLYLLCTSGSTGVPKPVTVPNSTLCYNTLSRCTSEDVQIFGGTLDWNIGLISLLAALVYGIRRIVTDRLVTAEYFMELVQKYKISITFQTPPSTALIFKSENIRPESLDSLKYYLIGGAPASSALLNQVQKSMRNGKIIEMYGQTEVNSAVARNVYSENGRRCLGRVMPGYKLRIINDKRESLGKNQVGELHVARPESWGGYYKNPEATREVYDEDGWLYTGDFGYIDEDNYVHMVGRKKELLKYKMMHYYPRDIEEAIEEIPDVKEVCVFGVEDEEVGEKAAAAVVKADDSMITEKEVIEFVKDKFNVEHKQLHAGCKFVREIPRTANNKYDRNATKKRFLSN